MSRVSPKSYVPRSGTERYSVPRLLGESFRVLDRQLHEGMVAAGFGDVRPAHYAVFRFLKPGGSRVAELAEEARMTKQSMGELVAYLERRGYVERLPDPRDGRARIVVWTEAGLRWAEAAAERLGEIEDALAERLGGQERLEELAGSLDVLMALSAEAIPTRAGSARNSARTS
jgi:MarR family transcriptional regulator, temperature-dependent positive regulator of motility